eukprot:71475-Prymnesium_polylepis.1
MLWSRVPHSLIVRSAGKLQSIRRERAAYLNARQEMGRHEESVFEAETRREEEAEVNACMRVLELDRRRADAASRRQAAVEQRWA